MTEATSSRQGLQHGVGAFGLVWLGQIVSLVGTGLTGFALGVWIYQTTGSVTRFTLVAVVGALPGLLLMPWLGVLIDRWGRRKAMLVGDTGAALRTLAILVLWLSGNLEVWHVYVAAALRSVFEGLQLPAYLAAVTVLVPERHHARANGMIQLGAAAAQVVSPAAAGLLLVHAGLTEVLLLDLATFVFGLTSLAIVRMPRLSEAGTAAPVPRPGRWRQAAFGWDYIRARPGLLSLSLFFAMLNFFIGCAFVLVTPLVLSFGTAQDLGWVLSIGGIGSLVGSLVMTAWGGPRRRLVGVFGFSPLLGIGLVLLGLAPWVALVAGGVAIFFFSLPIVNSCNHAIWQKRVPPEIQGRVFTTRTLIAQITAPLAYLTAGALADRLFEPLLQPGGALAGTVGAWLGVGDGRGIGFQLVVMGGLLVSLSALSVAYRPLRQVEDERD